MKSVSTKRGRYVLYSFFSVVLFLLTCEIGIRYTGLYATLSEKNGNGFLSLFQTTHHSVYQNYRPNDTLFIKNTEFSFIHIIDSLGFRNTMNDSLNRKEIIALGDSFTEGLGAPQDSTWPALLSHRMGLPVYNAGVMGSDPVFAQKIITAYPFPFDPKVYLIAINFSDITDIVIRGGKERFKADSSVVYSKPPGFMPIYRKSHLFRAFIHLVLGYDYMFNSPSNRVLNINSAIYTLCEILYEADTHLKEDGDRLVVFIHPVPHEYYKNMDRRLDFKLIDSLEPKLKRKGVEVYNIRSDLESQLVDKNAWMDVSWPIDGHFNSKGYDLMAEIILNYLSACDSTKVY